jgi:hypothetical protein
MILIIDHSESIKSNTNIHKNQEFSRNFVNQLNQLKINKTWSLKDKTIVIWVVICFICTLISSVIIVILMVI